MRSLSRAVDRYIADAPAHLQSKLTEVREAILETAPEAKESISYRIPFYSYKGRLAWFGLFQEHISLFIRPPVVEQHKRELVGYETTTSAVHLPIDSEIPAELVKRLVRARIRINEAEEGARTKPERSRPAGQPGAGRVRRRRPSA